MIFYVANLKLRLTQKQILSEPFLENITEKSLTQL